MVNPDWEEKMETEKWIKIDDFDYYISSHGNVKNKHGKFKKLKMDKYGYLTVGLWKNGEVKYFTVHRLVATYFVKNPKNKPQVNHIDEDKTNNYYTNLEWVTAKENINHGTRNHRVRDAEIGSKNHKARAIIGIDLEMNETREYDFILESEKDGFCHTCIIQCCKYNNNPEEYMKNHKWKRLTHKGYRWFYKEDFMVQVENNNLKR